MYWFRLFSHQVLLHQPDLSPYFNCTVAFLATFKGLCEASRCAQSDNALLAYVPNYHH